MTRWQSVGVWSALVLLLAGVLFMLLQPWLPQSATAAIQVITNGLPLPLALGLVVVLFVGIGVIFSSDRVGGDPNRHRFIIEEIPPEIPQVPPAQIGEDFEAAVASAALDVQIKGTDVTETAPREQLLSMTIAVLTQQPEITETQAKTMIERGEWTSDAVAQGFLSDNQAYPFTFRLIRWARPRLAYEHAVERTIDALEALATETITGYTRFERRVRNTDSSQTENNRVEQIVVNARKRLFRRSRKQSVDATSESVPQADGGDTEHTSSTGERTVESRVSEEITNE